MSTIQYVIWSFALIAAAFPSATMLLYWHPRRLNDGYWLTICVMLALWSGTLTLAMFWLAMANIHLDATRISLVYLLCMTPGILAFIKIRPAISWPDYEKIGWKEGVGVLCVVGISLAILFNAAYWPFSRDDALGIYHPQAVEIFETGLLTPLHGPDSLYLTYPPLIPLTYAYSYFISGEQNEYLARVLGTLLSLGCIPTAYTLSRMMKGRFAGWVTVLLLIFTPTFGRWASAGYVDLPMAFFFTLSALFAWRLWHTGHWLDAALSGAAIGLAAWTKNAALIGVGSLGVWLLWCRFLRKIRWRTIFAAVVMVALIAGPWYLRNLIGASMLVPSTAWVDQAEPTLANLLVLLTTFDVYGFVGWVLFVSWIRVIVMAFRAPANPTPTVIALYTLPFFGAWWLLTSYDPRFLLALLPLFAVAGGILIETLKRRIAYRLSSRLSFGLALAILGISAYTMWYSIEFKDEILRNPMMSDLRRHQIIQEFRTTP